MTRRSRLLSHPRGCLHCQPWCSSLPPPCIPSGRDRRRRTRLRSLKEPAVNYGYHCTVDNRADREVWRHPADYSLLLHLIGRDATVRVAVQPHLAIGDPLRPLGRSIRHGDHTHNPLAKISASATSSSSVTNCS